MKIKENFVPGLEGVIAAETAISFLDTEQEKIIIKGNDLIELSKNNDYLDVVYLLFEGLLPTASEKVILEEKLKKNYDIPEDVKNVLRILPKQTHPMDAQRIGISMMASYDDSIDDRSLNLTRAYQLMGQLPSITVNSYRLLNGQKIVLPKVDLSYSANFLYMITGQVPSELEAEIFDRSLLLYQ